MTLIAMATKGRGALSVAAKGKGHLNLVRRAEDIGARYGFGPRRMDRRLAAIHATLERFGYEATLPVTAAIVERNPSVIARYSELGIEFAAHGYYHVDHTRLSEREQSDQLTRARRVLGRNGLRVVGFRAPYLRWNRATLGAARDSGFLYDSSRAMHWPIDPVLQCATYRRGLTFYGSVPATDNPVLPRTVEGIVQIPYCLPDDEAVVDRLRLTTPKAIAELWLAMQRACHERGELFTLGLHPERIEMCLPGFVAVLEAARAARPRVWVARLEEIARWWRARAAATVAVADRGPSELHISIRGPKGLTVLARNLEVSGGEPWVDDYVFVRRTEFDVRAKCRPFVGVHPSSPTSLIAVLREEGFIIEVAESASDYPFFVDDKHFGRGGERALLAELESGEFPILRLGRWPDAARSALSVTGDVDALTIWDYAFRLLGR
jgi:peptidoglycan/xylan/chitin deacetylase (PgdA/CDA1 family)